MRYRQILRQQLSTFSTGEQKIVEYVLKYPDQLKALSSQALANMLSMSQSSIIKFVKKMGFKGYTDFKVRLVEEWGQEVAENKQLSHRLHKTIDAADPLQVIAQKLLIEKQQTLLFTTQSIQYSVLEQVLRVICKAKRIQITGLGGSSLVAKDLAYKMLKLGYGVLMEQDGHVQITIAQSLTPDDVQIVISFSGKRREIVKAAEVAKENGAVVIALTSPQVSQLRAIADYTLDTVADEARWRSSPISARTAQNTLIDLIFFGLLQTDRERSQQAIQQSQYLVDQLSFVAFDD